VLQPGPSAAAILDWPPRTANNTKKDMIVTDITPFFSIFSILIILVRYMSLCERLVLATKRIEYVRTERYIATQTYVPLFIKAQYQTSEVQDMQLGNQIYVVNLKNYFKTMVIPSINFD
jgi:hypothetical protein